MAFSQSIAGQFTGRLWSSPLAGAAVTFGTGAGAFAGASTFAGTDGTIGERTDAGLTSALQYGAVGAIGFAGVVGAAATAGAFRAGWEGYKGPLPGAIGYGAARNAKDLFSRGAAGAKSYGQGLADEWKSLAGWRKVQILERPMLSGGLGAVVGGLIGSKVSDDSTKGAVVGASLGAGAGIAIGRVARGSRVWGSWNPAARTGVIMASSIALGGVLRMFAGGDEPADRAVPEDNGYSDAGVRDRMARVGAQGDLVFGLHNGR
jgi:hypothetical protein